MKKLLFIILAFAAVSAKAQVVRASLQASGLTCSMCSKAVLNALQKVNSVEKVQADIKTQEYHISFKEGASPEFDALTKAVEDAGFSVARFTVTANLDHVKLGKDEHILIGDHYFHFLNAAGQELNGTANFTIVDKSYTTAKNFKKYSGMSKMECVQTGKSAKCCARDDASGTTRIYHAII